MGVALAVAGCTDDDANGVHLADSVQQDEFGAGTCLDFDGDQGPDVVQLPVIDCGEPHTHEVYHVVEYDDLDEYPGFAELEARARTECLTEFEGYVGIGAFDSTLFYTWIVPTIDSWNDRETKDREILCLLGPRDDTTMTGRMRDRKI